MGSIFKLVIVLTASIGGSYLVLIMFKIISSSREKSKRIDDFSGLEFSKKELSETERDVNTNNFS